jgi:hypothetical protein
MANSFIGSPEHKEVLCRFFVDSHLPYKPAEMPWPDLNESERARLAALPVWNEAVKIESETALAVQVMARDERDPVLKEAITVQGYEEGRHAELLWLLTQRYGIDVPRPAPIEPKDKEWAFMRIGYSECFDSFFAFGLFAVARDSGFFPPALVKMFEPVVQEEARHILFHANWIAYTQSQLPFTQRPSFMFRRALAAYLMVARRVQSALKAKKAAEADGNQMDFTMKAYASITELTPGDFLRLCLKENERRLGGYDERLLRPTFVPSIARAAVATGRL